MELFLIKCATNTRQASDWSVDRLRSANSRFNIDVNRPQIYFTGEMVSSTPSVSLPVLKIGSRPISYIKQIFQDMFDSYTELNQLKQVAEILATTYDWPALYNETQLANNEVPVYAASYVDDMYVHFEHSAATAKKIKGCKQFITNAMYHDALRNKSDELMRQLFAMRDDTID